VVHNDDTEMTILSLEKDESGNNDGRKSNRQGVFTTGIVSRTAEHDIALFRTGRKHAGENLQDVLQKRALGLTPPLQMCDGLDRNKPEDVDTILGNCSSHARRKFVDVASRFPLECRHVLEVFREVYRNEKLYREEGMDPQQRLLWHQRESGPLMEDLLHWLKAELEEKRVEPNSALGKAFSYVIKRWEPLTLFLRVPGAPIDNNICERILKVAIRHRTNSLFYKTERGAWVGDVLMSLIHTARLAGANPFEYLVELQRHAERVREGLDAWLPWNYRATLAALDTS
jgi:hypothetical protein